MAASVTPAATQSPCEANPAASVEVTTEGMRPTVAMAAMRHQRQSVSPAT